MTRRFVAHVVGLAMSVTFVALSASGAPAPRHSTPAWLRPDSSPAAAAPAPATPWRLGLSVSAVGALLAVAWVARRVRRVRVAELPVADITVLATQRIGPKSQAVIVEAGGRVLLLGVSETQVSRLYRLRNLETKARPEPMRAARALTLSGSQSSARVRRFADMLDGMLDRRGKAESGAMPADLIAGATRDVVTRDPRRVEAQAEWEAEEQTAGLVSRLGRRPR